MADQAEKALILKSAVLHVEDPDSGEYYAIDIPLFDPSARAVVRQDIRYQELSPVGILALEVPTVITSFAAQGRILKNEESGVLYTITKEEFDEQP